ncbi:hypothetical protein PTSG_01534 [Salpingoeca rosetta]|uniref:Uncharacterized protein n=1 Tax=Salpingoeca rosetta (strain ATCC 50818 / BSB-021) TaxID=946362 RepID=F2U0M3_SALR5|nr:uncharacterized protein PTSG_01534 [Salpingoeca rosetta]EGD80951.1 hypothetical protein PTSG_01534 [Salpingoeca rosetta]|eukprot:XP_004997512.1 hypothetical protein PTSG_01534 [Salpingoeca rosetta]
MATLAKAKKENARLRASTKKAVQDRRAKFKGETVPDVSNDLAPYTQLPVQEEVIASKEVTYDEGWTYKTRRTSFAPIEPHQALQLEEDNPDTYSPPVARRRASMRRMSMQRTTSPAHRSRSQSPRRPPAQTILENESFPVESRFAVWCKANLKPVLDSLTLEDKHTSGQLPVDKVVTTILALSPPLTEAEVRSCVDGEHAAEGSVVREGVLDYDKWIHHQKVLAVKEENRVRRTSLPTIPIHLPNLPKHAPTVVDFVTLPKVREQVKSTQQKMEEKKAKEEMKRTIAQLERVAFHKVKSKPSREKLEQAYVTYSGNPRKARRALQKYKQTRTSPKKSPSKSPTKSRTRNGTSTNGDGGGTNVNGSHSPLANTRGRSGQRDQDLQQEHGDDASGRAGDDAKVVTENGAGGKDGGDAQAQASQEQ